MKADWDIIRMQYELYGATPEALAAENQLEVGLVRYAIEEEGWTRQTLPELAPENPDSDDLMVAVQERLGVMDVMKTATMHPRYIALESSILMKAKQIVDGLANESPVAADQLKKVAEVLNLLKTHNGMSKADNKESGSAGITVQILNQTQIEQATPNS